MRRQDITLLLTASLTALAACGDDEPACPATAAPQTLIEDARCAGEALSGAQWSGAQIVASDFDGANLSQAVFTNARIERSDFEGAQLGGAQFDGALLSQADMANADLSGASFVKIYARNSNLSGATLDGATLASDTANLAAQFVKVKFFGASMVGATLRNALFVGADFRGADLSGATVHCADFSGARLNGANMTGADLTGTYIGREKPENLTNVTWSNTTCPDGTNSDDNGGTCLGHLDYVSADTCPVP